MKNKLLLIAFAMMVTTVKAQNLVYDYDHTSKTAKVTYTLDDNDVRVIYPASLKAIPEKAPNGYRVTAIGKQALADCPTEELTIPATVVTIEDNALDAMKYLKKVIFADGDEPLFIGTDDIWPEGGIFTGNNVMEEVYIGRNLTYNTEDYLPFSGGRDNPAESLQKVVIGEKVTSIPYKLFAGCGKLKSITIGSHVTTIEEGSISSCKSLESVVLPEGLTTIKAEAFKGNTNMKVLQIPSTLKEIGKEAFSGSGIETLTIPAGMETIGDDVLVGMVSLKKMIFEDSDKPLFIGTDTTWPVGGIFNGNTVMEEIYVGRNLTYDEDNYLPLSGGAAPPSTSLQKATIGEKVTRIPFGLFQNCGKLSEVTWGSNVTEIEASAFQNCKSMTNFELPKGVTIIKANTFKDCSELLSIQLPPNLVELGEGALNNCSKLEELSIPGTIETIGHNSITGTGLKRLTIADGNGSCAMGGAPSLYSGMFRYVPNLVYFYIGKNITFMEKTGSPYLWSECKTTDIVVGSLVTKIENEMFQSGANAAINVRLGSSLKTIGSNNFKDARDMASLTCEATEPPICADEKTIFTNVNKETCQLIVPATSIEAYRKAPVWKEFFNIQALPETKCAIPTANIVNGKLVFQCATEGVEFHCEYVYPKGGKVDGNNIPISQSLTVSVYATKAGLDDSDVATYQLVLGSGAGSAGDANGDGIINAADIVTIVNTIMGQ